MAKKRKFRRGGSTTVNAPSTADVLSGVTAERRDTPEISVEPKLSKSAERQDMSFGQAFRNARNSGDNTFMWRGRSYGTQMAGERSAAPAPARRSTPTPAPTATRRSTPTPAPAAATRPAAAIPAPATRTETRTLGMRRERPAAPNVVADRQARLAQRRQNVTSLGSPYSELVANRGRRPREAEEAARTPTPTPRSTPTRGTSAVGARGTVMAGRTLADISTGGPRNAVERYITRGGQTTANRVVGRAKGGSVSSRGDGIAKRGKTKGKIT